MISTKRVARKHRRCDECGYEIKPGEEYYRHACPPWCEPNFSSRWMVLNMCGRWSADCKNYWNIDAKELSKEPLLIP